MPDEIQPALTPDEWHAMLDDWSGPQLPKLAYEMSYLWGESRPFAAMAICNAALPDNDPRKITREDVRNLRAWIEELRKAAHLAQIEARGLERANLRENAEKSAAALDHVADALAALLPPET